MGTTESNVDHAASGQTVAGDSGELTFTYAQDRFASEGKDWESPVVTNMAASVSADAGNVPAGSITNTGTNNTFTSTTESSLATLLSNQCPFVIKATIFEGNGKNAIRERHTFTGSVLRQLDQASALLNGINESGQYPAIALREALVNAGTSRLHVLRPHTDQYLRFPLGNRVARRSDRWFGNQRSTQRRMPATHPAFG